MNNNSSKKLANKLQSTKNTIKSDLSRTQASGANTVLNTLSDYSNSFKRYFNSGNQKNSLNTTAKQGSTESSPTNPYILGLVIVIALIFIGYGTYVYLTDKRGVKPGKTFYGENLLNYEPLFTMNSERIEPCIDRCNKDTLCSGITFDADTLTCQATQKGRLREDTNNFTSWVKDTNNQEIGPQKMLRLQGFTAGKAVVKSNNLPMPYNPSAFTYSFVLYLADSYYNQGTWRHLMHKGTAPEQQPTDTPHWENIAKMYPDQYCGVWLAPFHSNLRICVTTVSTKSPSGKVIYPHAYVQATDPVNGNLFITDKPNNPLADTSRSGLSNTGPESSQISGMNLVKRLEYIDIANIPTNRPVMIGIVCNMSVLEVYMDGKLHKIQALDGQPEYNNGDLFIMSPKTISGNMLDISYLPKAAGKTEMQNLAKELDAIQRKYENEITNITR